MKNKIAFLVTLLAVGVTSLPSFAGEIVQCNVRNTQTAATTPAGDFEFHSDGTLTHKRTGLMWTRCLVGQTYSNGQCFGNPQSAAFDVALTYAEESNFAGYTDWRLPNIKEAMSIIEQQCARPAINLSVFPSMLTTDRLVTSTTRHGDYRTVRLHTEAGAVVTVTPGAGTNFLMVREP